MHVATTTRQYKGKTYKTSLLRRTFREGGKVKHETLANLSALPADVVQIVGDMLKGKRLMEAGGDFEIERSLAHGHVAAVVGTMRKLGLDRVLRSRRCQERDIAVAMIAARVIQPDSKLATARWWHDTTLLDDLGLARLGEDDEYRAMDWLLSRQGDVERSLAARHLPASRLVLYDLSSSYMEGRTCPLAKLGHSRDGKRDKVQIEYGLLTDQEGRPIAVEVFAGNTADASTVMGQIEKVQARFDVKELIIVGDRGMITKTRIAELSKVPGVKWITAMKASSIKVLYRQGALEKSLFDQRGLAEIQHPDYPRERLVVCRNPFLAEERRRKRNELLDATEKNLRQLQERVAAGRLKKAGAIGVSIGRIVNQYKMAKHFELDITASSFSFQRKTAQIEEEAALDGIYIIRTSVGADLSAEDAVRSYKMLTNVEQGFRCMKTVDLEVRPIYHHLEDRVRAHVFLCMLAYYVEWHMRHALSPMLFMEEDLPALRSARDPVAPAQRSTRSQRKAHARRDESGGPIHSFRTLIEHLGSLRRDICRYTAAPGSPVFTKTTRSTAHQRKAFELLGVSL